MVRVDLKDVIEPFVTLKKGGKNYQGCCPFHDEKTPSFTVSPEKQFYYCFGCGAHGNAITFIMNHQQVPFTEAVERLANHAGLTLPERTAASATQARKKRSKPLVDVMSFAQHYFQSQLEKPSSAKATQYLRTRNLTQETIETFGLGYAPAGWNNLTTALNQSSTPLHSAIEAGLIIEKSPTKQYDRFRDRIMFPIRSSRGDIIAFGGRVLNKDEKPKYLNSPETPLFQKNRELYGLYEIRQRKHTPNRVTDRIVVVEGYLDVLMLAQHGVDYAVATLGTSTSRGHLETLFKQVSEVIFCFDGDDAGKKAAKRALETSLPLVRDGRQIRFLFLPEGEDPDSLIQKDGRALFEQHLNKAHTLPEFLFETARAGLDLNQIDQRARLVHNASPLVNQLPKSIYRELVIQQLADLTQLEKATVIEHIERANLSKPSPQQPPHPHQEEAPLYAGPDAPPPPALEYDKPAYPGEFEPSSRFRSKKPSAPPPSIIADTIRLLLHNPEIARTHETPKELVELNLPYATLLLELIQLLKEEPNCSAAYLFGHWHGSEKGDQLASIAAQDLIIGGQADHQQTYQDTLKHLKRLHVEQLLDRELNESMPNPEKITTLLQQQRALAH